MAVASDKPATPKAVAKPAMQLATPVKASSPAKTEASEVASKEAAPKTEAKPEVKKAAAKPVSKKAAPKKTAAKPIPKKSVANKAAPKKVAPKPAVNVAVQDEIKEGVEDVTAFMNEQINLFSKMGFDMFKSYEEVVAFNKDNLDAVVKSSTIMAEGLQSVSKDVMALTQTSVQENVSAAKALFECKDAKAMVELQSKFAKDSYDKFIAEAGKISDASTKLAEDAWAPLNSRVNVAMEAIKSQSA